MKKILFSVVGGMALTALSPLFGFAGTAHASPVDDVLSTCPTIAEMNQIRSEIAIDFDEAVFAAPADAPWTCTEGGTESSTMLNIYNVFRLMKVIQFDAPMPITGAMNLYDWFRSLHINVHVFAGSGPNSGGLTRIMISNNNLIAPSNRYWFNGATTTGMMDTLALFVHEARHTTPGGGPGHACPDGGDTSIATNGSWAAQYYFLLWLADHSGTVLSDAQKTRARLRAASVYPSRFCGL